MKQFLALFVSGILGGLVVFFGIKAVQPSSENGTTPVYFASSKQAAVNSLDFTAAAAKTIPSVVHIKAAESRQAARERNQERFRTKDPWDLFSMEDFFGGFSFFESPRPQRGSGSGVIIGADGYIITNNHVVDFADDIEVTTHDDKVYTATLIGTDPKTDLAVVKIEADNLSSLVYGSSENVTVGEWVLAVGNPFDLTSTVTAGIVSAKGRDNIIRASGAIEDFIQTDAAINPGNSGGALVNLDGELIGINTAIATPTSTYAGYAFAIPSAIVEDVVKNIIDYGAPRAQLGVSIASVKDYEDVEEVDLGIEDGGVIIVELEDGGAAQYGGLLPLDVILSIDGQKVTTPEEVTAIIASKVVGETVDILIDRNGMIDQYTIRLKT